MSAASVPSAELLFREGRPSDLHATFELAERALDYAARRGGVLDDEPAPDSSELAARWRARRPFIEFVAAQPDGCHWVCEEQGRLVGFVRVARFGAMEELTELMVEPEMQGRGIGRGLMERCWPGAPTPELGRVVVAAGGAADLSLYTAFGVMPITGHWHVRHRTEEYVERRSQETADVAEPGVHALGVDRAIEEWCRLEPPAIGHERPRLHEFFARDRTCLATVGADGDASGVCWVSPAGEIGPAVGATPEDLVPVVLAALDRVAKTSEPDMLGVFCTTDSWWLLRRLRTLGFHVFWPSWVMCSVPLPRLDSYLPTRPPHVL